MTEVDVRPARPVDVAEPIGVPASPAQARIWVIEQIDKGRSSYNVPLLFRLRGPLDAAALTAALNDVVRRHEALRTTFTDTPRGLYQTVQAAQPVPVAYADLSGLTQADRDDAVARAIAEAEAEQFDLRHGPLIRARLLRIGGDEHVFVGAIHHIALDARSLRVVEEDFARAYADRAAGIAPDAYAAPAYTDYTLRQLADVTAERRGVLRDFWVERLAGLSPLDLAFGRPEPAAAGGGFVERPFPVELLRRVEAYAAQRSQSVFDVVATAVSVLLSRYTNASTIPIGAVVDDRAGADRLVGPCTNTVVVRIDLDDDLPFAAAADRVADAARGAYAHAALPFDEIVSAVGGERTGGRNPLFQVYLGVDESGAGPTAFGDVAAEKIVPKVTTAKFDLGFGLHIGGAEPVIDSGFRTDLFDAATVVRLLDQIVSLLAEAVADPERPIGALSVLTPRERHEIAVAWNETARAFPSDRCLHDLVRDQAVARPDAPALHCGDITVTYADLDARAAALAAQLRRIGVGRDRVVGIRMRRSPAQAIAVLAVLKAAGAFLPLDPDYPADRLAFMVSDSGAVAVLSEEGMDPIAVPTGVAALSIPPYSNEPIGPDTAEPEAVDPADLAYVIYTSGSTGTPKGVMLTHRGAVNNFTDFNDRFAIGPGDAILAVSSPSFDMSVYDLLGTLAAGAAVVQPQPQAQREPRRWLELLRRHKVTVWHSAPALLDLLLDQAGGTSLPDLRLALLGGDWIAVSLPDRLRQVAPAVEFISLGGATEASMDSIIFPVGAVDPGWTSIPYGRPMANQRAYVLDERDRMVPVGVAGQLHLSGIGLARGYLNRPELTDAKFVTVEVPGVGPERMYRTGDLARYRPDGVIELLGRMDFQVKVHGLRIETGEIESVLRAYSGIKEAVVVAQGERGSQTLAAFVVTDGGAAPDVEDVRRHLAAGLPSHMVPPTVSVLDRLPVTPNGKVDRLALTRKPVEQPTSVVADLDPEQERVAAAWRTVLGVAAIGPDDDFFQLGGDSFAAVKAMYAIDPTVAVVELFRNPTVRTLAAALASGSAAGEGDLLVELTPAGRIADLNLICVPYGGGSAVSLQTLADALPERMALWAVALPGHDPNNAGAEFLPFAEAAERIADEALMRIDGPLLVYGHCAGVWLAMEIARLLEDSGADLRGVYAAAALPHPDPDGSIAETNRTSDQEWAAYLRSIGGFEQTLGDGQEEHILRAGRHTHLGAMRFQADSYQRRPRPLSAPLHAVFGDTDPALPNYTTDHVDWLWYADHLDLAVIRGGGHYFVRTHAGELAALIDQQHPDGASAPGARWQTSAIPLWTIPDQSGLAPKLAAARED